MWRNVLIYYIFETIEQKLKRRILQKVTFCSHFATSELFFFVSMYEIMVYQIRLFVFDLNYWLFLGAADK